MRLIARELRVRPGARGRMTDCGMVDKRATHTDRRAPLRSGTEHDPLRRRHPSASRVPANRTSRKYYPCPHIPRLEVAWPSISIIIDATRSLRRVHGMSDEEIQSIQLYLIGLNHSVHMSTGIMIRLPRTTSVRFLYPSTTRTDSQESWHGSQCLRDPSLASILWDSRRPCLHAHDYQPSCTRRS